MMRARLELLGLSLILASCGGETEVQTVVAPTFDIDSARITVSGVSPVLTWQGSYIWRIPGFLVEWA